MPGPAASAAPAGSRRAYIDWLRGIAVLCMVLWHSIDAWHEPANRETPAFFVIGFFAGWAAPMFLFLAGVSLPMAAASRMARGATRQQAAQLLRRRGWQVFALAHLFRLQSFLLNPHATWNSLLKPDILNILGLGLVLAALGWERATTARGRIWWLAVPAIAVLCPLTPWIPAWHWPSLLHPRLEGYIRVVDGNAVFSLFPAVAYVLAGTMVGSLLAERRHDEERRFHVATSRAAVATLVVTVAATLFPPPAVVHAWLGPLLIVTERVAAMLLMMGGAWWLLRRWVPQPTDPLMVFGRTSLFVYWVHVELSYGSVSYPLHRELGLPAALAAYGSLLVLMYVLARLWMRRVPGRPLVPPHMAASRVTPADRPTVRSGSGALTSVVSVSYGEFSFLDRRGGPTGLLSDSGDT